jgi:hypothetical protein
MLAFATASHAGGVGTVTSVTGQAPSTSIVGQPVTLTASVTGGSGTCTGNVTFTDTAAAATICTAALTGAVSPFTASCSGSFPVAGTRNLTAAYGGVGGCNSSTSLSVIQTVNAAPATVPTMAEWAMWGFAGLLLMFGAGLAARRVRRSQDDGFSAG